MGAQAGGAVTASLTPWIAMRFGWGLSFVIAACMAALGSLHGCQLIQIVALFGLATDDKSFAGSSPICETAASDFHQ